MYIQNPPNIKKIREETNQKKLKQLFKKIYRQPTQKNIKNIMKQGKKALNRNTFQIRAKLMHRKDIDEQPYFNINQQNQNLVLENIPTPLINRYGLQKVVATPMELVHTTVQQQIGVGQDYFVETSLDYFNRRITYAYNDYNKMFKRLDEKKL